MIRTILWDVDGTLLDFLAAEAYGMRKCFREIGYEMDDAMLSVYSEINRTWWEKHERGEVTQKEIFNGRFMELFDRYGLPYTDFDLFNDHYQKALGEAAFPMDDSLRLLAELKGNFRQYVVTNGSRRAQRAKLAKCGIDQLVDGIFISEEVGAQKPYEAFFAAVQQATGYDPVETVIIGDSLTSDMRGGNQAGIFCIWYNPNNKPVKPGIRIDATVRNLWEIPALLQTLS